MGQTRSFSAQRFVVVVGSAFGVLVLGAGCGSEALEAKAPNSHMSSLGQDIHATQRDASMYSESVQVLVNNYATQGGTGDWCTGTIIAPQVVLTAAHCVAFNHSAGDAKTWTIVAPFAAGGSQSQTTAVGAAETIDPAGWAAVTRDDYYNHLDTNRDIGLIYLPQAFTGVVYPTLSNTQYKTGTVSAVGRSAVMRDASLVLSGAVTLSGPAAGYAFDNQTKRITDGGDSGGALFLDGTHTIVGTESNFDEASPLQDYWMRLDGGVYTFIQGGISNHGGVATTFTSFRDKVASALCTSVASCCAKDTPGYAINSTQCQSVYDKLGFDATARGITNATVGNAWLSDTSIASCLGDIAAITGSCDVSKTQMQTALAACVAAVNGRVATGGACKASAECANKGACALDGFGNGKCQAIGTAGSSCQVNYVAGTTVDARDNIAQELCAHDGAPGSLYCDAYDFAADTYRTESSWKCANPQGMGAGCDSDQYCSSLVCIPYGEIGAYTCADPNAGANFVTTALCDAFKN